MLRAKKFRTAFLFLPFVFCLCSSGVSVADDSCFQGLSTIPGNVQYDESWLLQWDPNNPEEMDRNSSVTISVIGGFPPYTWQVSGNGFSIPSSTADRTNTLSADNTACGTTTITVTDSYGQITIDYVRCTSGRWGTVEFIGQSSLVESTGGLFECIIGGYKYHTISVSWSCNCWDYQLHQYDYDKCVNCFNNGVHFGQLIDNPCTGGDVYDACSYSICIERNNRNARLSQWFRQAWVCD